MQTVSVSVRVLSPRVRICCRYARLFASTGKAFVIENCHAGDCTEDDNSGCATVDWCPFNTFRVSRDIDNTDTRWFMNLQAAVRFLDR